MLNILKLREVTEFDLTVPYLFRYLNKMGLLFFSILEFIFFFQIFFEHIVQLICSRTRKDSILFAFLSR